MDYKNMSTQELAHEYNKWTPNPADAVPTQNMYHARQMRILKEITREQGQALFDYAQQNYEQTLDQTKTIAYGAAGLFFLFVAWAFLAA